MRSSFMLFMLCLASFVPGSAYAWQDLSESAEINCTQPRHDKLRCNYRLLTSERSTGVKASANGMQLPSHVTRKYPDPAALTAVLFLVDTSDPGRESVVKKNVGQIDRMLKSVGDYHVVGLASFDSELRLLAPIGTPRSQVAEAASGLKATGKTTELYRNLINAVEILSRIQADRRVIYVFSDGQAEDKAYFHQDVIRAARRGNVIINSMGFPRSVALSVALQTLRRLSEETGGVFIEANSANDLPVTFLDSPFANVDRGGTLEVDLGPMTDGASGSNVTLEFSTARRPVSITVPVSLPARAAASEAAAATAAATAAAPAAALPVPAPEARIAAPTELESLDEWLWYGVPAALIVLLILTGVTLVLTYRKPGHKDLKSVAAAAPASTGKPLAYLIAQDEKATRYPITNPTWRIGRSRDNEMTLNDNSISRRHAEIQRYNNGTFVLFDRGSLNGVFVNEQKVAKQRLKEGDIIEIGDIFLRFTESPADYQLEDDTAMQHTKSPTTH